VDYIPSFSFRPSGAGLFRQKDKESGIDPDMKLIMRQVLLTHRRFRRRRLNFFS